MTAAAAAAAVAAAAVAAAEAATQVTASEATTHVTASKATTRVTHASEAAPGVIGNAPHAGDATHMSVGARAATHAAGAADVRAVVTHALMGATTPAVPTVPAAPAEAAAPSVAAPIPARPLPCGAVPAVLVTAVQEFLEVYFRKRRIRLIQLLLSLRQSAAGDQRSSKCDRGNYSSHCHCLERLSLIS
jgi:hypothetical protein